MYTSLTNVTAITLIKNSKIISGVGVREEWGYGRNRISYEVIIVEAEWWVHGVRHAMHSTLVRDWNRQTKYLRVSSLAIPEVGNFSLTSVPSPISLLPHLGTFSPTSESHRFSFSGCSSKPWTLTPAWPIRMVWWLPKNIFPPKRNPVPALQIILFRSK